VEERDQLGVLAFFLSFFSFVIGCGPVQMALAWVLPPLDHSQVEVEFPRTPYLQNDGGIVSCLWIIFFLCRYAAQEVCG
jgi:hypothetical protein